MIRPPDPEILDRLANRDIDPRTILSRESRHLCELAKAVNLLADRMMKIEIAHNAMAQSYTEHLGLATPDPKADVPVPGKKSNIIQFTKGDQNDKS